MERPGRESESFQRGAPAGMSPRAPDGPYHIQSYRCNSPLSTDGRMVLESLTGLTYPSLSVSFSVVAFNDEGKSNF